MPRYTNTYSRGNNDPTEDVYETSEIEVTLDVDTSDCSEDKEGRCSGDVKITLEYKATSSTGDPMFVGAGPRFALREPGPGGGSAQLTHAAAGPAGPQGDTLTASLSLAMIPCSGGTKKGEIGVEARILLPGGGPRQWTGYVQQRISFDVEITSCGEVNPRLLELEQLTPDVIMGRILTPVVQTGSSYDAGPFPTGYPDFPGRPR